MAFKEDLYDLSIFTENMIASKDKLNNKKDLEYYLECCNKIVDFYVNMKKTKDNLHDFFDLLHVDKYYSILMILRNINYSGMLLNEIRAILNDIVHAYEFRFTINKKDSFDYNIVLIASILILNTKSKNLTILDYEYKNFITDSLYTDSNSTNIMIGYKGSIFRRRSIYNNSSKSDFKICVKKDNFIDYLINSVGCFECVKNNRGYGREINIIDLEMFNSIKNKLLLYKDFIYSNDFESFDIYSYEYIKNIKDILESEVN